MATAPGEVAPMKLASTRPRNAPSTPTREELAAYMPLSIRWSRASCADYRRTCCARTWSPQAPTASSTRFARAGADDGVRVVRAHPHPRRGGRRAACAGLADPSCRTRVTRAQALGEEPRAVGGRLRRSAGRAQVLGHADASSRAPLTRSRRVMERAALERAVGRLPEREANIVSWYYFEGRRSRTSRPASASASRASRSCTRARWLACAR